MTVGFIGLGNLGKAIAGRLIDQGESPVVYNRTASKSEGLAAIKAGSIAELVDQTQTVFLCLFDSPAVDSVLTQVLAADASGKLIIDLTTNHHRSVQTFHNRVAEAHAFYLESPVLGSVVPATRGELTALISGEEVAFHQAEPLLKKFAKTIHFLGEPGRATRMKLINNFVLGGFMATICEALLLAERAGLSRAQAVDILLTGAGSSGVLNAKKEKLLTENFTPHFSSAAIHKDLGYLLELARDLGSDPQMASAVRFLYQKTIDSGSGDLDLSELIRHLS